MGEKPDEKPSERQNAPNPIFLYKRMITTNVSTLKCCAHPCVLFARLSQSKTVYLAARPVLLCAVNENGRKYDNNKRVKG